MIDAANVPPVAPNELVSRFATQSKQFRADSTVKQELFLPPPPPACSVMLHRDAQEAEIWQIGIDVAASFPEGRTLYGRADITVMACTIDSLRVVAKPILPKNPNHADIEGWPPSKEDKKALAQKLAAVAGKLIQSPQSVPSAS